MAGKEDQQPLKGRRILIVEDEILLALDLELFLESQGSNVLGSAKSVDAALALVEAENPDAVTLDMNLNGESSAPVAAALQERGIPFVFVTGNAGKDLDYPAFHDVPLVKKPYDPTELVYKLVQTLA
ncbi:response regulator [Roseovarius sp. D0-M9]|uniref:response regulator n=1 Tax=Roseovarius sp. D0-M9 TaxID=3127117 RepID=UPI00301037D8